MTWQEDHIANAERQIAFARSCQPGQIGAVPLAMTTEIDELPLEALGERPVLLITDRHRLYEEDFNALANGSVEAGRLTADEAADAKADFHIWMTNTRFSAAQTSPRFYQ